jgi:ketosteroid isomerase-like protein
MKTYLLKTWILIFIFSSVCFAAQTQTTKAPAPAGTDPEFSKLIKDYYAAWNSGSLDKAGQYYAKSPDLVFYDVSPLKYKGWSEYRAGVEKIFLSNYSEVKLTPYDDLKVSRHGPFAWTTLTFKLSGKGKDGKMLDIDCRHTAIWQKRSGKWLVVHEHVSTPLQGS